MSRFLSEDELYDLTHLERPSAQARWLSFRGIPSESRSDGTLAVLWSAVESKLGGSTKVRVKNTEPNWDAVRSA